MSFSGPRARPTSRPVADLMGRMRSSLYRLPHGSLDSGEGTGERRFKEGGLMVDYYARKAAQDHLDAAQKVDATARAVDVSHPNGDTLD